MNWNISAAIPHLIGLVLFATIYAYIVYRMGDNHRGYTSLLVVVGVAVTVSAIGPVIGWANVLIVALAFSASGVPMIVGDICKALIERQKHEDEQVKLLQRLAERGIGQASEVNDAETESTR